MSREPPNVTLLLNLLNEHDVRYLVTGSAAAMLHGVELQPGDLDITPALDRDNLARLARVLEIIEAPEPGREVRPMGDRSGWRAALGRERRAHAAGHRRPGGLAARPCRSGVV